mmetsp:Transcript_9492/g.22692  ORF Transcript_9492/g.22692 Transcript_9492/m.22692 type:complete len:208 (+) Transcript_9492:301-924(+)
MLEPGQALRRVFGAGHLQSVRSWASPGHQPLRGPSLDGPHIEGELQQLLRAVGLSGGRGYLPSSDPDFLIQEQISVEEAAEVLLGYLQEIDQLRGGLGLVGAGCHLHLLDHSCKIQAPAVPQLDHETSAPGDMGGLLVFRLCQPLSQLHVHSALPRLQPHQSMVLLPVPHSQPPRKQRSELRFSAPLCSDGVEQRPQPLHLRLGLHQ